MKMKNAEFGMLMWKLAIGIWLLVFGAWDFAFAEDKDARLNDPVRQAKSLARELQQQIIQVTQKVVPSYVFVGGGSGVLISSDGYILTNYHVVGPSVKWDVTLTNGRTYNAERVGYDKEGDIALLKIKDGKDLPYLELGDSDNLKVGQPVIAVGNPFAIGYADPNANPTVTFGFISALHRFEGNYNDAIQTDTPINPGNSGGPLITLDGKVVGINGKIEMRFQIIKANTGIGYAIPVNQIKRFLPKLKNGGEVYHGYLSGLTLEPVLPDETSAGGVKVTAVEKDSEADKIGFQKGDCIIKINEYPIYNFRRFYGVVGAYPAGEKVTLTVKRGDETITVSAVLEARKPLPETTAPSPDEPFLGVRLAEPPQGIEGVIIQEVITGSPAAKAKLLPGDIIIEFAGNQIKNIPQLSNLIKKQEIGKEIELKIIRDEEEKIIKLTLEKRGKQ